jgi:hypothetical protein
MRVRVGFDFDMPLNWRLNLKQQSVLSSYAFIVVFGGGKYPASRTKGGEVLVLDPAPSFVWVPSCRPLP